MTRRIARRTFLGGAGAALALPYLEAMMPRNGRAALAADGPPKRLLFYYVPNGMHMPAWTPVEAGAGFQLSPTLAPLAPYRDDLVVLTGLANEPAFPEGPGDHAAGTGSFLTATHVYKTEGSDIRNGISVDQVAANARGGATRLASLQLGAEGGTSVGGCDSGYSCAYSRNISWSGPSTPLPKVHNPQLVFDRLFGGFDPNATAEEQDRRRRQRASVLDYALDEANQLRAQLGARDQQKLDEYFTSVRDLEIQIQTVTDERSCEVPDMPASNLEPDEHLRIMTDLMVLALRCDVTRIISFMLGNAGSTRNFPFLGISDGHHDISHHQNLEENHRKLERINLWEMEHFAYLLQRMRESTEPDGSSLLDNSLVFFSSEIEDGNTHYHRNLPVLLAGGCGGKLETGRHLVYDDRPPIADLFISILDKFGAPVDSFGDDGTGTLAGL